MADFVRSTNIAMLKPSLTVVFFELFSQIMLSPSLCQHVLDTQASNTPKGVVARLQTELEQLQQQLKNNQNNNSEVENGQNQQKQDRNLGNQVVVLKAKVEELEDLLTSKAEAMGLLQGRMDILQQVISN